MRAVYRGREDGGIQKVPQMVVPRTWNHIGGEGNWVKDK